MIMRKVSAGQQGMGMTGLMFTIVVAVFALTMLFKLGPAYMNYWSLRSIMNSVAESSQPIVGGKSEIMRALETRMMVNEIRNIDPKSFTVKKTGENTMDVSVDYERREHLFFNVDAVLTFHHTVMVKGQ
jgi:hypothetical protein